MRGPQARRDLADLSISRGRHTCCWGASPRLRAHSLGMSVALPTILSHPRADPGLIVDTGSNSPGTGIVCPAPAPASRAILPGQVQPRTVLARLLRRGRRGEKLPFPRPTLVLHAPQRSPPRPRSFSRPGSHPRPEIFHAFSRSGSPPSGHGAGVTITVACPRIGVGAPRSAVVRCQPCPVTQKLLRLARPTKKTGECEFQG